MENLPTAPTQTFPPAGFVRVESHVEGVVVYAPAPPEERGAEVITTFKCPNCGADRAYSAVDGGLRCSYCGYHEVPETPIVGKAAEEFEFKVDTLERAQHGWGVERKELQCQNCGAVTTIDAESLSHTCPFCGSNKVIEQKARQDNLRPRFLIPPAIGDERCREATLKFLGSSWMTPRTLKDGAIIRNFSPLYLPFWTFDATTHASWRAEVGHTRTTGSGKNRRTTTVWRWESGNVTLPIDDLLVSGTTRVSPVLQERIANYDTNGLLPYEPKFLAGIQAHAYERDLETCWEVGRGKMREMTKKACMNQASTKKIRNFSMTLDFADESWRYVLLPVYVSAYQYEDKTYQLMVNAQTGTVNGQRPVAWNKVYMAIGAIFVPGMLALFVGACLLLTSAADGDAWEAFLVVLAFLFGGAGALAASWLNTAHSFDDV